MTYRPLLLFGYSLMPSKPILTMTDRPLLLFEKSIKSATTMTYHRLKPSFHRQTQTKNKPLLDRQTQTKPTTATTTAQTHPTAPNRTQTRLNAP